MGRIVGLEIFDDEVLKDAEPADVEEVTGDSSDTEPADVPKNKPKKGGKKK